MGNMKHDPKLEDNHLFHSVNPLLDPDEFRRQGHLIIDFIADYYRNIEQHPVLSQVQPGYLRKSLPESPPNSPESLETILQDVRQHIVPGLTHWQSPSFFGYFPASISTPGFLGEMLGTGFNVVGFNWVSSPAVTELEAVVMDWMGEMLRLPKCFLFGGNGGGVLQGTTCEAILSTLVASRDQLLKKIGRENMGKLVVYGSDQTHSALQKAAKVAGIHPENFRAIKTNRSRAFTLTPESLRSTIQSDLESGLIPFYLCLTVGTTATNAVDPLSPLCEIARAHDIWVHVDAAYAGSACICPEFRHFIDGVEGANSFTLNAHKWFFVAPECCCLWVKDPSILKQSLSVNPPYLSNKATDSNQVIDYKDWQITLSRRFRALKLWLVIRSYGVNHLKNFLRHHVRLAKHFEALASKDKRFELVVPRNFALVCFRVLPIQPKEKNGANGKADLDWEITNLLNARLLEAINASGKAFVTHAVVGGMYVIRFSVGASMTEERHVDMAWKVVRQCADEVLNRSHGDKGEAQLSTAPNTFNGQ